MKLFKLAFSFFVFTLCFSAAAFAQEWQWSTEVTNKVSHETNAHPVAFLWIPPNCKQVRGVVFGQHNMLEEGIFEHPAFRKTLTALGFAEVWVTPGIDLVFNFNAGAGEAFDEMMKNLAHISGYTELEFAPVVPIGHSAAASYPWNFGAWDPSRTLAMLSVHGDAPLTNLTGSGKPNPDWGNRNIDGIPGLFVMGEYEWWEKRITPAMNYRKAHPKAVIAYLADAGHGHFDFSDELVDYLGMFITKVAAARLPAHPPLNKPVVLKPIDPAKGWLVDRWRKDEPLTAQAAPYADYSGNKEQAGWAMDQQMAVATEKYYAKTRGKLLQHIGYVQQNKVLGTSGFSGFNPKFIPLEDGISFHLSAVYRDTLTGKIALTGHSKSKIVISRICGPVKKINDTTFQVSFYRMGFNNSQRSNDIWLIAKSAGDDQYKSAVQQADMKIPLWNKEGQEQKISFPAIAAQKAGTKFLQLNAVSDANVPVSYYVKEGPAEIHGNMLVFTGIPPRSKFPVKVTVVAWQYGRGISPLLKSAEPVEQVFYINR